MIILVLIRSSSEMAFVVGWSESQ